MLRLNLDVLIAQYRDRTGKELLYKDIAKTIFKGQLTRPRDGQQHPFDHERRGVNLLGDWNRGKSFTALKPDHIIALARLFKEYDVRELFVETNTQEQ